ncbi:MAG: DNA-packaging protein [Shimia sp.]|uniref:DNA-packaging protein n=1 Tax=Shimia sp. TaxID=1954381 RepID=UPI001B0F6A54|nr:terminase family protein [Shimia sp.]MBO6896930.1 DNA-packaging protein [Shimia sp.]
MHSSTSTPRDLRSGAAWIASEPRAVQSEFLDSLTEGELLALPFLFEFWAMPHQVPPEGDWKTWVSLGGRGAGKTRAGAEWVRSMVEGARPRDAGKAHRVALVGETIDQVREVMIFGESGLIACAPPDRRPVWEAGRRRLVWPNGAVAQAFSAHDPESLRGPQFDAAWVDELAKWRNGQETWDMLQFALWLGENPRQVVTTTPRNVAVLKRLLEVATTVQTSAPTQANRANLAESFLAEVEARYSGTRLGRQELDGILMEDAEVALWTRAQLDALRCEDLPEMDRIVVAVDPPVTGHAGSDECGIVVMGAVTKSPVPGLGTRVHFRPSRMPGRLGAMEKTMRRDIGSTDGCPTEHSHLLLLRYAWRLVSQHLMFPDCAAWCAGTCKGMWPTDARRSSP